MKETQRTICDWADKTFGYSKDPRSAIKRMLKEVEELKDKMDSGAATFDDLADEMADIFITGYRVFDVLGFNGDACVDHKMEINRARKWKLNGDGTGQHIKE